MKIKIISLIFLLIAHISKAQWQWAKQIGGSGFENGFTTIDLNNNIYCLGTFQNQCYFSQDTIYASGDNDLFIAKYDQNGVEQWVKKIGSNNPLGYSDNGRKPIVDNVNSCIYITGSYYNSLSIDNFTVTGIGLEIFLAKIDFSGNCIWLKTAGSISSNDQDAEIAIDSLGNLFWSGILKSNGKVDSLPVNKGTFLAKISPAGIVLWAKKEMTYCEPTCMKVMNNHIYISGITRNDTISIDTLTLFCNIDAFFTKTDIDGRVVWAKIFGGNYDDYGWSFELGNNNDIFYTGRFNDSISFDGHPLVNQGKSDMFFAKLDSNGNLIWIQQSHASGLGGAGAYDVVKDFSGNYYVIGDFQGNAKFGTFIINATSPQDVFINKYDENGNCLGIRNFGVADGSSIKINSNGSFIITGGFYSTINIGPNSFLSKGGKDLFIATMNSLNDIKAFLSSPNNQLFIHANPNAGKCNITIPDEFAHEKNLILSIYNNQGKLIQQLPVVMSEEKIKLSLEAEAKGMYNAVLSNGVKSYSGKIVFE